MPMRYANPADVYALLSIDPDNEEHQAQRDQVERIENGLADNFDTKIGTSFNGTPIPETRTVRANGNYANGYGGFWYPEVNAFDLWWDTTDRSVNELILSTRIRSVTAIAEGGTWNGTAWEDGTLIPLADYQLTRHDGDGYWGILRTDGTWSGFTRITGIWADQVHNGVPDDVREALTFLTADQYRLVNASPMGTLGPDNLMVRARNAWSDPVVKTAIDAHRVVNLIV